MIITYNRLVQQDVNEICTYYDEKGDGLGDDFFAEFESTLEGIREMPGRWPPIKEGSPKRKARMKRFPYVIVYHQITENRVKVFVVKHQKRRESFGSRRT